MTKSSRKELLENLHAETMVHMVIPDDDGTATWMDHIRARQGMDLLEHMKLKPEDVCDVAGIVCLKATEIEEPKILL